MAHDLLVIDDEEMDHVRLVVLRVPLRPLVPMRLSMAMTRSPDLVAGSWRARSQNIGPGRIWPFGFLMHVIHSSTDAFSGVLAEYSVAADTIRRRSPGRRRVPGCTQVRPGCRDTAVRRKGRIMKPRFLKSALPHASRRFCCGGCYSKMICPQLPGSIFSSKTSSATKPVLWLFQWVRSTVSSPVWSLWVAPKSPLSSMPDAS